MNPAGNKAGNIQRKCCGQLLYNGLDKCQKKHCKRATKLYETAMTMLRNSTKYTVKQQWEKTMKQCRLYCKTAKRKNYESSISIIYSILYHKYITLIHLNNSGTCTVMWTPQRTVFECCRDRKAGVYTPTIPCLPTSYGSRQINSLLRENLDKSHRLNKRVFIFTDSTVWTQKDSCLVFTSAVHRGYKCTEHVL
jgi:hypothetical protein